MPPANFSAFAGLYSRSRLGYPAELFAFLASLTPRHELAWDCATGNGQAALGVADHFDHVIATDISEEQIRHATPHPRIEYRAASATQSGLADTSVDLITVAAAVHWFDLEAFGHELRRVLRPGGIAAAFTYHVARTGTRLDEILWPFYREIVGPYFAPQAKHVDDRYERIELPGTPVDVPDFHSTTRWNTSQILGFVRSWSGTQNYIRERGQDPVHGIEREIEAICGGPDGVISLRFPLYVRVARL